MLSDMLAATLGSVAGRIVDPLAAVIAFAIAFTCKSSERFMIASGIALVALGALSAGLEWSTWHTISLGSIAAGAIAFAILCAIARGIKTLWSRRRAVAE